MANFVYVDSYIDRIMEKPWLRPEIKTGIEISHYRTFGTSWFFTCI